jgi:hypothetical protein
MHGTRIKKTNIDLRYVREMRLRPIIIWCQRRSRISAAKGLKMITVTQRTVTDIERKRQYTKARFEVVTAVLLKINVF